MNSQTTTAADLRDALLDSINDARNAQTPAERAAAHARMDNLQKELARITMDGIAARRIASPPLLVGIDRH